jgi:hypothetical protein
MVLHTILSLRMLPVWNDVLAQETEKLSLFPHTDPCCHDILFVEFDRGDSPNLTLLFPGNSVGTFRLLDQQANFMSSSVRQPVLWRFTPNIIHAISVLYTSPHTNRYSLATCPLRPIAPQVSPVSLQDTARHSKMRSTSYVSYHWIQRLVYACPVACRHELVVEHIPRH